MGSSESDALYKWFVLGTSRLNSQKTMVGQKGHFCSAILLMLMRKGKNMVA